MMTLHEIEKIWLGCEVKYTLLAGLIIIPTVFFVLTTINALSLSDSILLAISVFAVTQLILSAYSYWDYVYNYEKVIGKADRIFKRDNKLIDSKKLMEVFFLYALLTYLMALPLVAMVYGWLFR